jgi:hypothetical protein
MYTQLYLTSQQTTHGPMESGEQPETQSPQPLSFEVGLVRSITEQPWW